MLRSKLVRGIKSKESFFLKFRMEGRQALWEGDLGTGKVKGKGEW